MKFLKLHCTKWYTTSDFSTGNSNSNGLFPEIPENPDDNCNFRWPYRFEIPTLRYGQL